MTMLASDNPAAVKAATAARSAVDTHDSLALHRAPRGRFRGSERATARAPYCPEITRVSLVTQTGFGRLAHVWPGPGVLRVYAGKRGSRGRNRTYNLPVNSRTL